MNVFVFSYFSKIVMPMFTYIYVSVFDIGIVYSFVGHSTITADQMVNIEISVYGIASYKNIISVRTDIDLASTFAIADYQR
jgi:hypothetical protein